MWNVKKILVPTDGSEASKLAVIPALGIAKQINAEVVALFVVNVPHVGVGGVVEAVRKNIGEPAVNEVVKAAEKENLKVKGLVEEGSVVDTILKVAEKEKIDLIVMGTRGASLTRRLLGSVASSVVTYASCPVLVVRPKKGGLRAAYIHLQEASF